MRFPWWAQPFRVTPTGFNLPAIRISPRPAGKGRTYVDPRTPSVVSRTCKPKPAGQSSRETCLENVSPRTVSPSLHPCPASGGALGFLQASALDFHGALRLPGSKDARCVRSTSATQTTCVHPHPVEIPARCHGFHRVDTPRFLEPRDWTGDRGVSRRPRSLRRIGIEREPRAPVLPGARAWALSSHDARCDRASDIPVATPSSSR